MQQPFKLPPDQELQIVELLRRFNEARQSHNLDEMLHIQSETSNILASAAAKHGDRLLIHLLAAWEESIKENNIHGNMVGAVLCALVIARRIGLLQEMCTVLAPQCQVLMFDIGRAIDRHKETSTE